MKKQGGYTTYSNSDISLSTVDGPALLIEAVSNTCTRIGPPVRGPVLPYYTVHPQTKQYIVFTVLIMPAFMLSLIIIMNPTTTYLLVDILLVCKSALTLSCFPVGFTLTNCNTVMPCLTVSLMGELFTCRIYRDVAG